MCGQVVTTSPRRREVGFKAVKTCHSVHIVIFYQLCQYPTTCEAGALFADTFNGLDVRNTTVASIDASTCPRLEIIRATGTPLQNCSVAETSPVSVLELPDTMTEISLVNLPNLSYPGGLTIAGLSNVTKLMISERAEGH